MKVVDEPRHREPEHPSSENSNQKRPEHRAGPQRVSLEQALELSVQHYNAGRFAEAEDVCRRILQAMPDQPMALQLLGVVAYQTGRKDEAVALIGKAVEVAPDYAEAHANLGNVLLDQDRADEAAESYRRALTLEPDNAAIHRNLGRALREQGKSEEAVESYIAALALEPDDAGTHRAIGDLLTAQGRPAEAISSYRAVLEQRPDDAATLNSLGLALRASGRPDAAEESLRRALEIDPGYAGAYNNLGIVLRDQQKLEAAVDSYCQALEIRPDYVRAHGNLGNVLRELGRLDEAEVSYRRALTIDPAYADAHKGLGLTLHHLGRLAEARDAYRAGIAGDKAPDIAHVGLRRVLIDLDESTVPAPALPDDQKSYDTAHPGLRIWKRPVDDALKETLYGLAVIGPEQEVGSGLVKDRYSAGIRAGNVRFSDNFKVLERDEPALCRLRDDLCDTLRSILGADVYFHDSFFNIYQAGSVVNRHDHIQDLDRTLNLGTLKYSLVYYVDAGDKTTSEPGILRLHDPDYLFDPQDGDIILFRSSSMHSTSYSGETDRIILGVNLFAI